MTQQKKLKGFVDKVTDLGIKMDLEPHEFYSCMRFLADSCEKAFKSQGVNVDVYKGKV